MKVGDARDTPFLYLIGLTLGPVALMLWLGRGRLAFIYLLAGPIFSGLVLLVYGTGLLAPPDIESLAILLTLPFNVVGIVHGLKIRETSVQRPWFSRWYAAIILPVVATSLIAFGIREFLFQPFNTPSSSMIPTLMVGDYFFVSKTAYGYSRFSIPFGIANFSGRLWGREPQRGDIVIFKLPRDNQTDYLKRLIGLPGDRIQLIEGIVYLNGEALKLTPVQGIPCMEGESCNYLRETLPDGRSYVINDANPNGAADNTAEYVVPPGHYFMLGDNRDNSLDSRFAQNAPGGGVGYVPYENLIGPAVLIFWSSFGITIDDRLQGYPTK